MEIKQPLCITSRLLPGVVIGRAEVSIEYSDRSIMVDRPNDGRQRYRWRIDIPPTLGLLQEFQGDDLCSGVGGGSLQEGLESLLNFLSAFAEAIAYQGQTGQECENANLFPAGLAEWATENADEFSLLAYELQEKPGEFIVE